jgi:hypothetical protein
LSRNGVYAHLFKEQVRGLAVAPNRAGEKTPAAMQA